MKLTPAFNKQPFVPVRGKENECVSGRESIGRQLQEDLQWKEDLQRKEGRKQIVVVETYQGVYMDDLRSALQDLLQPGILIDTAPLFRDEAEIRAITRPDVTDDRVFGYLSRLNMEELMDAGKVEDAQREIERFRGSPVLIFGYGASLVADNPDLLIYADMARWEIQQRMRRNEVNNLGIRNMEEETELQYKRGFFVDWRICDRLKKKTMDRWDYVLDTNDPRHPKMATGEAVREGLRQAAQRPFSVVPFFDPGPWGGQWMKERFALEKEVENFAWCFNCIPEENSLLLGFGEIRFEIPAINLVFYQPRELLGDPVHARFGDEFPIRFDFLDTMAGGNLSLQVHPLTEYIQEKFGMHYTQDESYYLMDAEPDGSVFLGLREGIDPEEMTGKLKTAEKEGIPFDAEKYIENFPARKHDHFLIPAGTVHCSGKNGMVLEISATPYIFTFKMYDWGRTNLDGKPRPLHVDHGVNNIRWERTTEWTRRNLVGRVEKIAEGDGWVEERTGLHEREFIETRRHWFTGRVIHHTGGGVNVMNLVEGQEAILESPSGAFEPFIVHYAETFIIPASAGAFTIRPHGPSEGRKCATIKAFVRTNP